MLSGHVRPARARATTGVWSWGERRVDGADRRGHPAKQADDRSAFVRAFSGDARHIVDYLAGEVLAGLDDDAAAFLIETSVLDTLTPQACDAVLGRNDSAHRLRALEEANLFLVPLDDRRHEYRYHHRWRPAVNAGRMFAIGNLTAVAYFVFAWLAERARSGGAVAPAADRRGVWHGARRPWRRRRACHRPRVDRQR